MSGKKMSKSAKQKNFEFGVWLHIISMYTERSIKYPGTGSTTFNLVYSVFWFHFILKHSGLLIYVDGEQTVWIPNDSTPAL